MRTVTYGSPTGKANNKTLAGLRSCPDTFVAEIFDRKSFNSLEASCCDQHDIKQIKVNFSQLHNKSFPDRKP